MLNKSVETIRSLVDESHDQKMTQQEISDITGIKPSNLAQLRKWRQSTLNYRLGIKEKKTLAFSWHIVYNNTEITFNMVSD